MTADNWSFVFAAYALAALVLGGYWRHLAKKERELDAIDRATGPLNQSGRGTPPHVPGTGHPRSEPATRTPRQ